MLHRFKKREDMNGVFKSSFVLSAMPYSIKSASSFFQVPAVYQDGPFVNERKSSHKLYKINEILWIPWYGDFRPCRIVKKFDVASDMFLIKR